MLFKILESDFDGNIICAKDLSVVKDLAEVEDHEPMIMSGNILRSEVRHRLNRQLPTIFIHRGYLGNHLYKHRVWWRYSINGFANTQLLPVPYSRWGLLGLPRHPWKVTTVKRVLIAPSKMTSAIWTPETETWAESMLNKFPGAEVRIRAKAGKPKQRWNTLWNDLDWADLVVSQASAITAEAFWYGKKVISLYPCPTWAAGTSTLDTWQDPTEPEHRSAWHEHLAWSQFTNQEWSSGHAVKSIARYIGPVDQYQTGYLYNFKNL